MRSVFLWLFFIPAAAFGLEWEKTQLTATVEPADSFYLAVFPFKNTSQQAVTIKSVTASCGCTTPSLTKQTYAAGESGEIDAVFNFEGHYGLQEKSLTVVTSEAEKNVTELRFAVTVPALLKLSPEAVTWERNESPQTKNVKIEVLAHVPALKLQLLPGKGFTAELQPTGDDGHRFELRITPLTTSEMQAANFSLRTEYPEGTEREFDLLAVIK